MDDNVLLAILITIFTIYFASSIYVFLQNRRHAYINKRNPVLGVLCSLGLFANGIVALVYLLNSANIITRSIPAIILDFFIYSLGAPTVIGTSILMTTNFVINHYLSAAQLKSKDGLQSFTAAQRFFYRSLTWLSKLISGRSRKSVVTREGSIVPDQKSENTSTELTSVISGKKRSVPFVEFNHILIIDNNFIAGFLLMMILIFGIPFIFMYAFTILPLTLIFTPFYLLLIFYIFFCVFSMVFLLGRIEDTIGIKFEVVCMGILILIALVVGSAVAFIVGNDYLNYSIQLAFGSILGNLLIINVPCIRVVMQKSKPVKLMKENGNPFDNFLEVFKDEENYQLFKKVVTKELSMENIMFLEEANALYQKCGAQISHLKQPVFKPMDGIAFDVKTIRSSDKLTSSAKKLTEKFIKQNSMYELNIPSKLRIAVEEALSSNTFELHLLEPIVAEVLKMLFTNSFPKLLKELDKK